MGLDLTKPSKSMLNGGNDLTKVFATERGWERQLADGTTELLHACKGLDVQLTTPGIVGITLQRKRNLSIANADVLSIKVSFAEAVTLVSGTPAINFTENGVAQVAAYVPGKSDDNTLVFEYPVAAEGAIEGFGAALDGDAVLNDSDSNVVTQTFPADFVFPAMTTVA